MRITKSTVCELAFLLEFILLVSVGLVSDGMAQESDRSPPAADFPAQLQASIQPLVDAHEGQVAVAIKHFDSGASYLHHAQRPMPTASLIKFPIMVATFQAVEEGRLSLADRLTLREQDKVPGSGFLTSDFSDGATFSLADAVGLMIAHSDNTATNLVIDQVGLSATTKLMQKLGCPDTQLHSKVFRRDTSIALERSRQFGLGSTSAADLLKLLERLHQRKLVSDSASQRMYEIMLACDDTARLTRLLPAGTKVAQKTGAVSAVRAAAGLIESPGGTIAVVVLTSENEDRRWSDDNAANLLCANVSLAAYQCFNPDSGKPQSVAPVTLSVGVSGKLVESLQRTLNARLDPSPEIVVDGDYGPETMETVMRFQNARSLDASGRVDAATWKALGPLVTSDLPVPDPNVINRELLSQQPEDSLTGPPFVTCKAWAIVDGQSGKFLWGDDADEPLDMASTTKIMTGLLVTQLAKQNPEILDETITFSKRADETAGSTAGVRTGEQVTVGELLYGLLLPSGNDASVALGEHFGGRLSDSPPSDADSLELFIDAMNSHAKTLGLSATSFRNTHGMTAPGHHTSARDLARLSWHAMQLPLFAEISRTRQRGTTVLGPGGYQRNVLWKNTNRLLGTAGYDGVKTGTTSAAGSCLASRCYREDESLIAVVLGSSSSDARYADTRNLFRWAWQQKARQQKARQQKTRQQKTQTTVETK